MGKPVTYEGLIREIRELRAARDRAEERLLLRLVEIERDHMGIIADGGCASFAMFCKEFVSPARFEAFKAGLKKIGDNDSLAIGTAATIVAARVEPQKVRTYVADIKAWARVEKRMPTKEAADRVRLKRSTTEEVPRAVAQEERREDELARLRAENDDLRARLRASEAENAKLRKQLSAKKAA